MRVLEPVALVLCLLAALCAENIPLMLALVLAAAVCVSMANRTYRTCPNCGANLDPGEICDCQKESVPGATNTGDGKADQNASKTI